MDILTINEAAAMLRVTRRTLYRRTEIPRIRIGHKIMFLREDLEAWVRSRRECGVEAPPFQALLSHQSKVDEVRRSSYHRNPIFRSPSERT